MVWRAGDKKFGAKHAYSLSLALVCNMNYNMSNMNYSGVHIEFGRECTAVARCLNWLISFA